MPVYWDFHKILSVEPATDLCAAYLPTKGRTCSKPLNPQKRRRAVALLYEMDRQKAVPSATFIELAGEMLCKEVHNSLASPHLNRVQQVSDKWQASFENSLRKEKPKRIQSILRQSRSIKSDRKDLRGAKAAFHATESDMKVCYLRFTMGYIVG